MEFVRWAFAPQENFEQDSPATLLVPSSQVYAGAALVAVSRRSPLSAMRGPWRFDGHQALVETPPLVRGLAMDPLFFVVIQILFVAYCCACGFELDALVYREKATADHRWSTR